MIRFDIFTNPMYLIFFSNIEENSLEEENEIEIENEKGNLEILIEKLNKESILANYPLIEGIVRLRIIIEDSEFQEKIEEKTAINKETIMNLNQFSIFKGIIDFI